MSPNVDYVTFFQRFRQLSCLLERARGRGGRGGRGKTCSALLVRRDSFFHAPRVRQLKLSPF